jgi:hypothetical protein
MSDPRDALRVIEGGADVPTEGVDSSGVVASGESEQALLLAGKISVDEYMDMTVDRTLAHLQGQVSAERLEMMRELLRKELSQDPHLASLVERVAAGD